MRRLRGLGVLLCAVVFTAWGQTAPSYEQGPASFSAHRYSDAVTFFAQAEKTDLVHSDALLFEVLTRQGRQQESEREFALAKSLREQQIQMNHGHALTVLPQE
jgi:hypothetical protein